MRTLDYFKGINVRDLTEELELHKVVISPPSDTMVKLWGKSIPFLDLPYWTVRSVGFVLSIPEGYGTDSMNWYFVRGGMNYYWTQVTELPGKQLIFVEARTP
jgi:hypothetical protein